MSGQSEIPLRFAVEMRGITRSFARNLANHRIDLSIRRGEIHCLVGENGAGKTTLMNVLSGYLRPDQGTITLFGKPVSFRSPGDALQEGIAMVHQHFMLIPRFTVAENLFLGIEPTTAGLFINRQALRQRIEELNQQFGLALNPDEKVENLSVSERQRLEILKALLRNARVLILDEPTSLLTPQEIEQLFGVLRELKSQSHTIILITHRIPEVFSIADRVTILRQGRKVHSAPIEELTTQEVARLMVGEVTIPAAPAATPPSPRAILQLENLSLTEDHKRVLSQLSLTIHQGEILGLAGVAGNGQNELFECLVGLRTPTGGDMHFQEKRLASLSPGLLFSLGISLVPQDRQHEGLILDFSLAENLILGFHHHRRFSSPFHLNRRRLTEFATRLIKEYQIQPGECRLLARQLSGGNQQKLVLARQLWHHSALIMAAHPTRGLDVAATRFVHQQLLEKKAQGAAILLISFDLEELLSLSDTIAVMYKGSITAQLPAQQLTPSQLGYLMTTGKSVAKPEP